MDLFLDQGILIVAKLIFLHLIFHLFKMITLPHSFSYRSFLVYDFPDPHMQHSTDFLALLTDVCPFTNAVFFTIKLCYF